MIDALFADESGKVILQLERNAWIGATDLWDIETVANRLTVRGGRGDIVLELILVPPGVIRVSRMDMRVADAHVLVANGTYAVGRHLGDDQIAWVRATIDIHHSTGIGAALEFIDPDEMNLRDERMKGIGKSLATKDREIVVNSNAGILVKSLGISIAALTGSFSLMSLSCGIRSLKDTRNIIIRDPDQLDRFIATGRLGNDL